MVKLPPNKLEKYIFSRVGRRDPNVIIGPSYGEDSAIIVFDGKLVAVHADPITGASELAGWLSVNIAANDIAVIGAKPRWLVSVLLLPEGFSDEELDEITKQIDTAAKKLGVMIIGGHSEYTPGLSRPIIVTTAIGPLIVEEPIFTRGAKPGDAILMTKSAGLEGTSILATDFVDELTKQGVSEEEILAAQKFVREISVVEEALTLARIGVNSMHDPTEGGVLGGLAEIAYTSGVCMKVWEEKIPIRPETKKFCEALRVDPLKLISSGVLLATLPRERAQVARDILREKGIESTIVGEVERGTGVIVYRSSGRIEQVEGYVEDELMRLWSNKR